MESALSNKAIWTRHVCRTPVRDPMPMQHAEWTCSRSITSVCWPQSAARALYVYSSRGYFQQDGVTKPGCRILITVVGTTVKQGIYLIAISRALMCSRNLREDALPQTGV